MLNAGDLGLLAQVPQTTALRWQDVLPHTGLIVRESDASDRRRTCVRLSEKGWMAVNTYLDSIREA